MENIKELKKKAKKEGFLDPIHIYNLGQYYYTESKKAYSINKQYRLKHKFEKLNRQAALDGCEEAQLFEGKYYLQKYNEGPCVFNGTDLQAYYKKIAIEFLELAAAQGNEEAKQLWEDLQSIKDKKSTKNKNATSNKNSKLYETTNWNDDAYTSFVKKHTLICCPACRNKIIMINQNTKGKLIEKRSSTLYDEQGWEYTTNPVDRPTFEGQTITQTFECEHCKLTFNKIIHTAYDLVDWHKKIKITYNTNDSKSSSEVLKILKKSEGKFEDK
ncbi:MAG: hypothetical protein IJ008_04470 [Clostridia bacterium]|nr:hypothetical protein [Clostridia bacterium]